MNSAAMHSQLLPTRFSKQNGSHILARLAFAHGTEIGKRLTECTKQETTVVARICALNIPRMTLDLLLPLK